MKSRRTFLATVLIGASLALNGACGQVVQFSGASVGGQLPTGIFGGNPNVAISAINTTGGIVMSRTSGYTPAFVQVSASAITATGTSVPYEDIEYTWDFRDPSGTEIFTDPVTQATVNANTDQKGPEGFYGFRVPGTYAIKLTCRAWTGSAYITAVVTADFVVHDYADLGFPPKYFDFPATGSTNAGTQANPFNTPLSLRDNLYGDCRIKYGAVFTLVSGTDNSLWSSSSYMRISPYGTPGARPKIRGNVANIFENTGGGGVTSGTCDDMVLSGIDIENTASGGSAYTVLFQGTAVATNLYYDNLNFITVGGAATQGWNCGAGGAPATNAFANTGCWGCTSNNSTANSFGFAYGALNWNAFLGCSTVGARVSAFNAHHFHPENTDNHLFYRWCSASGSGGTATGINGNVDILDQGATGRYYMVSNCDLRDSVYGVDVSQAHPGVAGGTGKWRDVVIQGNFFTRMDRAVNIDNACLSITMRDNYVTDTGGNHPWGLIKCDGNADGIDVNLKTRLYRNKIYLSATNAGEGGITLFPNQGGIFYQQQAAQMVSDNIIWDARGNAACISTKWADQVSSGSVYKRNQYYTPGSGNGMRDMDTFKTIAAWRAQGPNFDLVVSTANPGWTDPPTTYAQMQ